MRLSLNRQTVWCRIEGIHLLHRDKTTTTTRLELHILCLLIVEIAEGGRCHHHIMTCLGSLGSRFCTTPRHDHRILRRAIENLVPSQSTTMFGGQEVKHALGEMGL